MSSKKAPRKNVVTVSGEELSLQHDLQGKVYRTYMERMGGRNVMTSKNQTFHLTGGEKGQANEKKKKEPVPGLLPQSTPSGSRAVNEKKKKEHISVSGTLSQPTPSRPPAVPPIPPVFRSDAPSSATPSTSKHNKHKANVQPAIPSVYVKKYSAATTPIIPATKPNNRIGAELMKNSRAGSCAATSSPLPTHVTPMAKMASSISSASNSQFPSVERSRANRDSGKSSQKGPKQSPQSLLAPTTLSKKKKSSMQSAANSVPNKTANEPIFKTPEPPKKKSTKNTTTTSVRNKVDQHSADVPFESTKSHKFRLSINPLLKYSVSQTCPETQSANMESVTRKRPHSDTPSVSTMEPSAKRAHSEDTLPINEVSQENDTVARIVTPYVSPKPNNTISWSKSLLNQRDAGFKDEDSFNKYFNLVMDELMLPEREIPLKPPQRELSPEKWDEAYIESRMPTKEDVISLRGYYEGSGIADLALKVAREKAAFKLDRERKTAILKKKKELLIRDERGPDDPPKELICPNCKGNWMKVMDLRRTNRDTFAKEVVRSLVCRDISCMLIMQQNVYYEVGRLFGHPKQAEMEFHRSRAASKNGRASKRMVEYSIDLQYYISYAHENKIGSSSSNERFLIIPGQATPSRLL